MDAPQAGWCFTASLLYYLSLAQSSKGLGHDGIPSPSVCVGASISSPALAQPPDCHRVAPIMFIFEVPYR